MSDPAASPRRRRGPPGTLAFVLLLLAPPLLLHARHLLPGRIPYLRDLSRTHLAMKKVAVDQLRALEPPLWDPGHGAGVPLLADANYFHLHPVSLLFLVLPYPTAFSLGLLTLSVLGSLGTGLWLRRRGLAPGAAAVGAMAFALGGLGASSANLYNLLASYMTVPWALLAAERLTARPGRRTIAVLALAEAAALAGGEPTAWAWCLALGMTLGGGYRHARSLAGHAAAAALSLGLAALQLVPLAAVTADSLRGDGFTLEQSSRYSLDPARLLELVWPYPAGDPTLAAASATEPPFAHLGGVLLFSIYAGVSVVALALAGLVAGFRTGSRAEAGLALGIGALSWLLALGGHAPLFPALWRWLPPLHSFRYPEKLVLPLFVVLALLAARGLEWVAGRAPGAATLMPWIVALDLLLAHGRLLPGAPARPFLEPPPVAADLASHRAYFWTEPFPYVPAGDDLMQFHLAYHLQAIPRAGLLFDVGYVFDLDPDGLDSKRTIALARLIHATPEARRRLLRIGAADRVVSPQPLELDWLEELRPEPVHVYRVLEPVAYARLLPDSRVIAVKGPAAASRAIARPDFDPRREAVLEGDPAEGPGGSVAWRRPRASVIEIDAEGSGLLVVSESFRPGWQATVDGQEVPIQPANLAFLGIPLAAPGRHQVRLRYRPGAVVAGAWTSAASLLLALVLLGSRRPPPQPGPPQARMSAR